MVLVYVILVVDDRIRIVIILSLSEYKKELQEQVNFIQERFNEVLGLCFELVLLNCDLVKQEK